MDKPTLKIQRDKLLARDDLAQHLVIEALTNVLNDRLPQFLEDINYEQKDELEAYLVFEGKEFGLHDICEAWQEQMDTMIKEKAIQLIRNKFSDITDTLDRLEEEIKIKVSKELDVEIDHY